MNEIIPKAGKTPVVLHKGPIAPHACVGAIEHRGPPQIFLVREPIPVRLVALVSAFLAQGLLISVDDLSVPAQEVACYMNRQSLVHVLCDEIVVAASCSRDERGVGL